MLTLITGTPGAFKTTYAVWELARSIPGTFIDGPGGKPIERKLISNINGLLVDHEHMTAANLENWYEWAKPGNVILFDEVQHVWRPRGLGSKVPPEIAALETHRHMGVDIIVITQHPMLVDPNIRRLVNRHLHLRRLANGASWVYEWDHCSNPHATKAALESKVWFRKKAAFALFTSAQAHTKTTAHIPRIAYFLIPAIAACGYLGWGFYDRMQLRLAGGDVPGVSSLTDVATSSLLAPGGDLQLPVSALKPAASVQSAEPLPLADDLRVGDDVPQVVGCVATPTACVCVLSGGAPAEPDQSRCGPLQNGPPPLQFEATPAQPPDGEAELVGWVNRHRQQSAIRSW